MKQVLRVEELGHLRGVLPCRVAHPRDGACDRGSNCAEGAATPAGRSWAGAMVGPDIARAACDLVCAVVVVHLPAK